MCNLHYALRYCKQDGNVKLSRGYMTGLFVVAIILSVLAVMTGLCVCFYSGDKKKRRTDQFYGQGRENGISKSLDLRGDVLDEQSAVAADRKGDVVNFDMKKPPIQLRCEKCGRLVAGDEFMVSGRCPCCGYGILKTVEKKQSGKA